MWPCIERPGGVSVDSSSPATASPRRAVPGAERARPAPPAFLVESPLHVIDPYLAKPRELMDGAPNSLARKPAPLRCVPLHAGLPSFTWRASHAALHHPTTNSRMHPLAHPAAGPVALSPKHLSLLRTFPSATPTTLSQPLHPHPPPSLYKHKSPTKPNKPRNPSPAEAHPLVYKAPGHEAASIPRHPRVQVQQRLSRLQRGGEGLRARGGPRRLAAARASGGARTPGRGPSSLPGSWRPRARRGWSGLLAPRDGRPGGSRRAGAPPELPLASFRSCDCAPHKAAATAPLTPRPSLLAPCSPTADLQLRR